MTVAAAPPLLDVRPVMPRLLAVLLVLTVATSSVVMFEPAPTDLLFLPTLLVAVLTGHSLFLTRFRPMQDGCLFFLLLAGLGSFFFADRVAAAVRFFSITVYLVLLWMLIRGLVTYYGTNLTEPLARAYFWAAVLTAGIGLLARFHLIPHAELFFRDESGRRIRGTFKDPNVLAPFLVGAIIIGLHFLMHRRTRPLPTILGLTLFAGAILFAFSRGAYFNLALAVGVYLALHLFVLRDGPALGRLLVRALPILLVGIPVLAYFLVTSGLVEYLIERLGMQDYDAERFGTQRRAFLMALTMPFGMGPGQWTSDRFDAATHNLYLRVLVENGWLGLFALIGFLIACLGCAVRGVLARGPHAAWHAVCLAVLVGIVAESIVIDTLHWRHFFLFLAIPPGLLAHERLHHEHAP